MMDHRALLVKYIRHVGEEEGSTYLFWMPKDLFSEEETAELHQCEREAAEAEGWDWWASGADQ